MAIQTLALFISHILPTKISASIVTSLCIILLTSVGGYMIQSFDVPKYLRWLQNISPQKWLLPVLTENEYSPETIANTAVLQLCRNKQVRKLFSV